MSSIPVPAGIEAKGEAKPAAPQSDRAQLIVKALNGYWDEASQNRESGLNPRDPKWQETLDAYWNRMDFSGKADWQAREVLPEVPSFIDRFAAAMKEAWIASQVANAYTIQDPADPDDDLAPAIKGMMDVWLSVCGRSAGGHPLGFEAVIEDQVKLGSLMSCSAVTTWRKDWGSGRVAIETVDPRTVWLDHTYRNLYRIRSIEMDRHKLFQLAAAQKGIWNLDQIDKMRSSEDDDQVRELEELTGTGQSKTSTRRTVVLKEFLGDIVLPDGTVDSTNALAYVADGKWLVRGPEANPFWHGRDWLTYAPLVRVPMSVYGKAYAEDLGAIANTFNKLTNLILDAVFTSSLKVFAIIPEMLRNPTQAQKGLSPGMTYSLQYGMGSAQDFMHVLDLGQLPSDAVNVWQALKNELKEAAGINEIGLGQFAPNSRTSATEIGATEQSSSAIVRSVAQTFETHFLEPVLTLGWKTGVQHMQAGDKALQRAAGPAMFSALLARRKELVSHPLTFQARGISSLIAKGQKLRSLIQVLQIIASNELLLQQFLQVADMGKLVELLFDLSNIDIRRVAMGERQAAMQQMFPVMQMGAAPGRGSAPAAAGDVAQMMGVGRA